MGEIREVKYIFRPFVHRLGKAGQGRNDFLVQTQAGFNKGCQAGYSSCGSNVRLYGPDGNRWKSGRSVFIFKEIHQCFCLAMVVFCITVSAGFNKTDR